MCNCMQGLSSEEGFDSGSCVQEVYEGVCKEHLLVFQSFTSSSPLSDGSEGESVVYIPASRASQESSAQIIIPSLAILGPTPECKAQLPSFICLSLFGVCTDSEEVVRPSSSHCERLRTDICAREWSTAVGLLREFGSQLSSMEDLNLEFPDCATLPNSTTYDCK